MSKFTVLLIDYEPRSIESLSRPLQAAGYEIITANDGIQGIEVFKKVKPDAVLIEAMIPKKHGFEVCQQLRTTEHGEHVPIAILTAVYKGRKYRHQAIHLYKCNEYLEKPVDEQVLLETLSRMLGGRRPTATPGASAAASSSAAGIPPELAQTTEAEIMERLEAILPEFEAQGGGSEVASSDTGGLAGDDDDLDEDRIDAAFAALEAGATTAASTDAPEYGAVASRPAAEADEEDRALTASSADSVAAAAEQLAQDGEAIEPTVTFEDSQGNPLEAEATAVESLPLADPDQSPAAEESGSAQVVSFDPERSRKRRAATEKPPVAVGRGIQGGTAAPQPLIEPEQASEPEAEVETEQAEPEEMPAARVESEPATESKHTQTTTGTEAAEEAPVETTAAVAAAAEPETRHEPVVEPLVEAEGTRRIPAWVWGVAAVVIIGAAAGAFFLLGGSAEPVSTVAEAVPPPVTAPQPSIRLDEESSAPVEEPSPIVVTESETAVAEAKPTEEPLPTPPEPVATERKAPPKRTPAKEPAAAATPEPKPVVSKPAPEPAPPPQTQAAAPDPVETTEPESTLSAPETTVAAAVAAAEDVPSSTPSSLEETPPSLLDDTPSEIIEPDPIPTEASVTLAEEPPATVEPPAAPEPRVRRGQLVDYFEVDQAPQIVRRSKPRYTVRAQRLRQGGIVELRVLVDEKGSVADIEVTGPIPGSDLNDSAVDAVRTWKYTPAMERGVPVKVWVPVKIEFKR